MTQRHHPHTEHCQRLTGQIVSLITAHVQMWEREGLPRQEVGTLVMCALSGAPASLLAAMARLVSSDLNEQAHFISQRVELIRDTTRDAALDEIVRGDQQPPPPENQH